MSGLRQACADFIAAHQDQTESGNDYHAIAYMDQKRTGLALARAIGTPMQVPPKRVAHSITEALNDERHQTQRRMIAALYWRAGEDVAFASSAVTKTDRLYRQHRIATAVAIAQAMEAAL